MLYFLQMDEDGDIWLLTEEEFDVIKSRRSPNCFMYFSPKDGKLWYFDEEWMTVEIEPIPDINCTFG